MEYRGFVTGKRNGSTVLKQVALPRAEVAERTLRRHKPKLHRHADRAINEDEQGGHGSA